MTVFCWILVIGIVSHCHKTRVEAWIKKYSLQDSCFRGKITLVEIELLNQHFLAVVTHYLMPKPIQTTLVNCWNTNQNTTTVCFANHWDTNKNLYQLQISEKANINSHLLVSESNFWHIAWCSNWSSSHKNPEQKEQLNTRPPAITRLRNQYTFEIARKYTILEQTK